MRNIVILGLFRMGNRAIEMGTGTVLVFGFEYCLILSMFYVWFGVSVNTQYV